jgi:hypothetical protein
MSDKLSVASTAPLSTAQLPPCPECGGEIGFVASPGGAIEWWRCTACQRFFPVRTSHCAHDPGVAGRCARCGGSRVAITVTVRDARGEVTMHFCSIAHARESLGDNEHEKEL